MSTLTPTVALGDSFLKSLMALPDRIMKKARETITKFQHDPTSPGLNYEKIQKVKDTRLRSIRIDQTYRCIVLKSEKGDTYILLWVDKHDDAYAWAEKRTCGVNPQTGAIQVVEVEETHSVAEEITAEKEEQEDTRPGLFEAFSDSDLAQIGATEELLPPIRAAKDDEDLERLEGRLPTQLHDALYLLACGENFDEVLDELGIVREKDFDPEDFEEALKLDANKQHFAAITDDAELEAILNEPLAKWRVFLHPSQRKLVRAQFNGPARVLGGAGTGKTVVAMHRAKYLASQCEANERILFTTFTKSLIVDIKRNLQKICSYDEIQKIEVVHLDAWCRNFLTSRNYKHNVAYGAPEHPLQSKLWEQALEQLDSDSFSADFLREEWDKVIQYHDIESLADYVRIPRTGRRGRLSRLQRKSIWPVFEEYRTLLNENQLWEPPDMFRAARSILEANQLDAGYKHIIVDEIQDFHPQAFRLLRAMVPPERFTKNDLFLVGDGHQNIYGHQVVLGQLGINIVGRGRRLRLNYRTPEETRRWASALLEGVEISDLDGSVDDTKGYRSIISGPDPLFRPASSFEEEVASIKDWVEEIREDGGEKVVCVAARTNGQCDAYAEALQSSGIDIFRITPNAHDPDDPKPVRVATMHRIKGLEFDHVCLAGLRTLTLSSMEPERRERECCLLHVAATRTKQSLLVTADPLQLTGRHGK
jgi:superfamily I DNA/RNA helicase/mRNA-degrading endonuclease RelE of RelBE toxin-antitoxin system